MSDGSTRSPRTRFILAAAAVILVVCAWLGVAAVALFFEPTTAQWVAAVTAAAVITEGALYVGAALLGITLFKRIRGLLWGGLGARDREQRRG